MSTVTAACLHGCGRMAVSCVRCVVLALTLWLFPVSLCVQPTLDLETVKEAMKAAPVSTGRRDMDSIVEVTRCAGRLCAGRLCAGRLCAGRLCAERLCVLLTSRTLRGPLGWMWARCGRPAGRQPAAEVPAAPLYSTPAGNFERLCPPSSLVRAAVLCAVGASNSPAQSIGHRIGSEVLFVREQFSLYCASVLQPEMFEMIDSYV
jgi:hypothetical protein